MCLTVIGIGWNWAFIGSTVLLANVYVNFSPREKARAQGFNDMFISLSVGVSMLLPPFFIAAFGWDALVWTMAIAVAFVLLTSVVCLLLGCAVSTQFVAPSQQSAQASPSFPKGDGATEASTSDHTSTTGGDGEKQAVEI